jgi:opacity protein-like surface antigen
MLRTLFGSIAAVALAAASSAALAADIPPPEPVPTWSGIYLGAGGGIQFGDLEVNSLRCTIYYDDCGYDTFNHDFDDNDDTFVGLVQGGFNWQIGQYYVGGAFVSWTFGDNLGSDHKVYFEDDFIRDEDDVYGRWNTQIDNMLTVASRQGILVTPNLLAFTLAGWSWADVDHSFRIDCDSCSSPFVKVGDNKTLNGLTVGIGAEYKWTDSISLRGEYRFTSLDNFNDKRFFNNDDHFARTEFDGNVEQVLFSLNWNFGTLGLPFLTQ